MQWFEVLYSPLDDFFSSGGQILFIIMAIAFVMWALVIERYLYFIFHSRGLAADYINLWHDLSSNTIYKPIIKSRYLSEYRLYNERGIVLVKMLVKISLLVGLLGTVVGMITVFDAYAVTQTNPIEEIAAGVAQAIIPTMTGMLVGLSGLYFAYHLKQIADTKTHHLDMNLVIK